MATLHEHSNGWHPGELAMHRLLKVPTSSHGNPTNAGLSSAHGYRVSISSLAAFGTLDAQGRPWTTVWGGERGFARPVAQNILGVQSLVDRAHDPVAQALLSGAGESDGDAAPPIVRPADGGKMMSGLSFDLETRDRVKLAGKMVVGSLELRLADGRGDSSSVGEAQIGMLVQEALGNCPKYINKKDVVLHLPAPRLLWSSSSSSSSPLALPAEALTLIEKADMLFLSSTNGTTMDTNHRGGPAGFIRVVSNSPITTEDSSNGGSGIVIAYPEFSGNRLYQSLGNLHVNPRIGVCIPDYDTSDVLYLTGETQLLVGAQAAALMPHTKLVVKIAVREARLVRDGLPFRAQAEEPSPYNPPVRRLATEGGLAASLLDTGATASEAREGGAVATLVCREVITPNINRFTFTLASSGTSKQPVALWQPGQHVTLDFGAELDHGWSHMRNDDPQSLNDDFVRTFTVSNTPPPPSSASNPQNTELQITARRHGPVTRLLWTHQLRAAAPLEIPVVGFGGGEGFRISSGSSSNKKAVFVAGGVGITPLLAQAPGLFLSAAAASGSNTSQPPALSLLWSLRAADLGLAVDTFRRLPGLAPLTRLFVTGGDKEEDETAAAALHEIIGEKQVVSRRRMARSDLLGAKAGVQAKFYVCAGPEMTGVVLAWLGDGEEVVTESFNY
ncbi:hypothetical protein B0T26DRAFT_652308 [Lasiosphaeria miniovina]|uniref:FAD-binding FR-type domain-containing protein n=1 Tax=Lasiosphaeria miniovina TaxID=1954250 RepID=A0AA40DMS0_9PEZI|nr:uncharacterized protein B0T26DRAFT_652308 [Lasiosphaeria miniovina]KAK0709444.1 hypothetical protein B0T26DRAFT_652308 [Lasiosphaeria miniovina]